MTTVGETFRSPGELSVGELVAVITPASIAAAAVYNLGFFFPLNVEFVTLLTAQDLLWGAALALLPIGSALYMMSSIARLVRQVANIKWWKTVLMASFLIFAALAIYIGIYVENNNYSSTLFFSAMGLITLTAIFGKVKLLRNYEAYIYVFAIIYVFFSNGYSSYFTENIEQDSEKYVLSSKTGSNLVAQVVRITSQYAFLRTHDRIIVMPLSELNSITRLKGFSDG